MSAVAKSEALIYKDARQYCQRRHQKTMGKCAREERQNDALLSRQLRHIQKSKSYRERELDREQEKCLTDLVTIFDRQCQIATTRLARRLKDALGDADGLWGGEKTESGESSRTSRKLFKKGNNKQLAKPTNGFIFNSWDKHRSFPASRGGKGSPSQKNNRHLPSTSLNDLITSRSNFLRRDNFSSSDSSPRMWQRIPPSVQPTTPTPSLNQQHVFQNQIGLRESAGLNNSSRGVSKRRRPTRPKTAPPTAGLSHEATRRWNELASPIRCPQHSKDTSSQALPKARSLRCLREECTKTEKHILDAPEDVCFRRQYLACAMSRKLPVSGLKSGSFAQQDEVRKKMDGRRRCMEELRMNNRQRSKSAPAGVVRMPGKELQAKC